MTTDAASNDFFNWESSRFSTLSRFSILELFFDHDDSRDSVLCLEWLLFGFLKGELLTRELDFKPAVPHPFGFVGDFSGSATGFDDASSERNGETIFPVGFGCCFFRGLRDFRGDEIRVDAADPLGDGGAVL